MDSNYVIRIVACVSLATSVGTSITTLLLFLKGEAQLSSEFPIDGHVNNSDIRSNIGHELVGLDELQGNDERIWLQSMLRSSAFVACVALLQIINSSILLASSTLQSRAPAPLAIPLAGSEISRNIKRPLPVSWLIITVTGVIVILFCFINPEFFPHESFHSSTNSHETLTDKNCSDCGIEMARNNFQKYFIVTAVYLFVHALEILTVAINAYGCKRSPKCSYSYCCGHYNNGYKLFVV